ncbi:MAG: UDP-N-acetylmuramate--L-alanine ligase [Tepidisphaeraceae bacterium]
MESTQLAGTPSRFTGQRVHFIGIGGSGMNGLASMLLDCGAIVTGSEPNPNSQTFNLSRRGAQISRDQVGVLLNKEISLVVRTAAVPDDNRELQAARAYGIRTIKYAQMLGEIMSERYGVAVAGTHGKSTTTAMIAFALSQCSADPSFVVGGVVPQLGGGSHSGAGPVFVAEACEFDRSFHNLRPRVAVITNVEEDHLDCYKNLDEIIESFRKFASQIPENGLIIANGADPRVTSALTGVTAPIELVGLARGLTWSTTVSGVEDGGYHGEVRHNGTPVCELNLSLAGEHNLLNATMALAACHACGADVRRVSAALGAFAGVERRMSEIGKYNGATVVDDYGHHPTEIRATLKALREKYRPARLFCVFQPHQHSRTRFLMADFARSFVGVDETIVPDIYFVRDSESERQRVSAQDLVNRINQSGQHARHLPDFAMIVSHLRGRLGPGDLLVTMGAGNVWEIGRELVGQ